MGRGGFVTEEKIMLWRVVTDRDTDDSRWDGCRVVAAFDNDGSASTLLVDAPDGARERIAGLPGVRTVAPAEDEIYIDSATRTTWLVTDGGRSVRLLGYLPP
jgi:hypothetical protein